MLKKNDFKNSIWLAGQYVVLIIFSFLGLKLNLLSFGKENFGIWILLLSFIGFGSAIDLGMGLAIVRWVSSKKTSPELLTLASNGFFAMAVLGIIITISILVLITKFILLNSKLHFEGNASVLNYSAILLSFSFYVNYLTIYFRSVFEGLNKFPWVSKLSILNSISQFICIYLVFLLDLEMQKLAALFLVNSILQLLIFIYLFKIKQDTVRLQAKTINLKTTLYILTESFSLQGANLLGAGLDPLIKYTIGIYADSSSIAAYELARRFVAALSGVFSSGLRNIVPIVSALSGEEQHKTFLIMSALPISRASTYFSALGYSVLSSIFLLANHFLFKFNDVITIFLICALIESTNNFGAVFYAFFIGVGMEKRLILLQVCNVILVSVFLRIGYSYSGTSIGLLGYYFSVIFVSLIMLNWVRKISKINFYLLLKQSGWSRLAFLHCLTGTNIFLIIKFPDYTTTFQVLFLFICFGAFLDKNFLKLGTKFFNLSKG